MMIGDNDDDNNNHNFTTLVPLMLQETILGWDCEWSAMIGLAPPSTIQISGDRHAWVIDGNWLKQLTVQSMVKDYVRALVQNQSIVHVFKANDDVKRLALFKDIPAFSKIMNVVDIDVVACAVGFQSMSSLSNYTLLALG